jgi:hypothetical protein
MMARILLALAPLSLCAQSFTQRGFLELRAVGYPQTAPGDSGRAVAESLLRYEAFYKLTPALRLAGAVDARADTHRQTGRDPGLDWWDRTLLRPALAVRRLSLVYGRGPVTAEFGKQFIRWGKADILNPTDRFAPRDFLGVVDNDFLAVTAARLTVERAGHTLDAIFAPRFTPSRMPLLHQRWIVVPQGVRLPEIGTRYPGGGQLGLRWNRLARGFEHSLSFFEGFNHLPLFDLTKLERFYPRLRMVGADAAVPLRWFTVKGEAAWLTSPRRQADEYLQYVVQLERPSGEWSLVGGYSGEYVTRRRSLAGFSPDRGLTRAFLVRASYTIDANRGVLLETAVRRNGDGAWLRAEYSQAFGQHWRATAGFTLIRGDPRDFLGQYRRNSHATLALRYSF